MKKTMSIFLSVLLCLALAGCGCEHDWKEADCLTPRTCSLCQEIEGEPLGHSWQAATCTEAETCAGCGEQRGTALGHNPQAATCTEAETCATCGEVLSGALGHSPEGATFQQSGVCSICGETAGEPLTPAFIEKGVQGQFVEEGQTYDYVTSFYRGSGTTTGKLSVDKYEILPSNQEGYEWRKVTFKVAFDDTKVLEKGIAVGCSGENYYDIEGYDASYNYNLTQNRDGAFTVNWNGQDYTECTRVHSETYARGGDVVVTFTINYEFLVPVGYDGMVVSFIDLDYSWDEGVYIYHNSDEYSLHFRLD